MSQVAAISPGSGLGWLLGFQVALFLFWLGQKSQARRPFARRIGQLLALLVSDTETDQGRSLGQDTLRALRRFRTLGKLNGAAWRWRRTLEAVYAQGYQAASETISSPALPQARLMRAAVDALQTERARTGANRGATLDPVVMLAYGLGAWPLAADLTSLEQLLGELGTSQGELRSRFDSVTHTAVTANHDREFRELAGASFVLGASARIVEAATGTDTSGLPPASTAVPTRPRSPLARARAHARKGNR
jgi:hypothetical protein